MSEKEKQRWLSGLLRPVKSLFRRMRDFLRRFFRTVDLRDHNEDTRILTQAYELNKMLMADIQAVPENEWLRFEKQILNYCELREFRPDYTESWVQSCHRLYFMVKWLEEVIPPGASNLLGLELGGITPATDLLNFYFSNVKWLNTTGDLRFSWKQESASADILVCTELLEHVSDLPDGFDDSFLGTGLKAVLAEGYRVLRPGGVMLVSTPNGGSIFHLEKTLSGLPPWFYVYHVREYTVDEIVLELRTAGFQIRQCKTIHCLTPSFQSDYTRIFQLLLKFGYSTKDRGDDIFITAVKPEM